MIEGGMELETIQNDFKSNRILAADYLLNHREKIKTLWEARVFEKGASKGEGEFPLIANSLGVFLDELAMILQQLDPAPEGLSENAMTKIYGGEKAIIEGYPLSRLLWEFSLVREVITTELQKGIALSHEVRTLIDRTIDSAMSLAASEFEKVQNLQLQKTLAKAEASNRDLDQFAMVAAHDLNSPLATVTSLLELLKECVLRSAPPEASEYILYMEQTLMRMRSLITSLLEYARLAQTKTNFQKLSLNDVLLTSLQNLAHLIEETGAQVRYENLPEIIGDFNLLGQVFQNLISNSIKYRGPLTPEIKISVVETSQMLWLFSVKDNGVGFEVKDNEEIFSLYKRLKNKDDLPGAGIGLATCRKVIELHGGKIWATSNPGAGSTFFFTLPQKTPLGLQKEKVIH